MINKMLVRFVVVALAMACWPAVAPAQGPPAKDSAKRPAPPVTVAEALAF
jgi:hypothetical protein